MQDIVITIPFNRDFYLKGQKLAWSLTAKSVSVSYIIYSAVTIVVLSVGITIDSKGGLPVTTLIGMVMLITILLKIRVLYLAKRNFFAKANYLADKYEQSNITQKYTFTEWGLVHIDATRSGNISWPLFDPVQEIKDNLILKLKDDEQIFLVINWEQISHEVYQEVKTFVITKTESKDG